MEREISVLEDQFPDAAKGIAEFSTPLAHQIIAGKPLTWYRSFFENDIQFLNRLAHGMSTDLKGAVCGLTI